MIMVFGIGTLALVKQFGQINFIGAAQNRNRIVNHHQPIGVRAARKTVSMVVYRSSFPDEKCIEFGKAPVIVFGN
jgi:hypothetical protein